jgi:hypothetical protein
MPSTPDNVLPVSSFAVPENLIMRGTRSEALATAEFADEVWAEAEKTRARRTTTTAEPVRNFMGDHLLENFFVRLSEKDLLPRTESKCDVSELLPKTDGAGTDQERDSVTGAWKLVPDYANGGRGCQRCKELQPAPRHCPDSSTSPRFTGCDAYSATFPLVVHAAVTLRARSLTPPEKRLRSG